MVSYVCGVPILVTDFPFLHTFLLSALTITMRDPQNAMVFLTSSSPTKKLIHDERSMATSSGS